MRQKAARLFGGLGITVTAVLLIFAWRAQPAANHPFFTGPGVMVIAHQGGNLLRPDNTLPAFTHAVELGVDVLEMDIHSTADGHLVVIHDDTVDRTTNGAGRVNDLTLAQIQALDAAYNWSIDDGQSYPYRGQDVTIPTLEEVLQAFPDMPMNIEIKQETPSIARPLCDLLRAHGKMEQVLVASFRKQAIEAFRAACPEFATSMVEDEIRVFFGLQAVLLGRLFSPPAQAFQVPEYYTLPVVGEVQVLTPRFVRQAQGQNIHVHAWTINEREDMERILATGVNGIITDRPDILLELLNRR